MNQLSVSLLCHTCLWGKHIHGIHLSISLKDTSTKMCFSTMPTRLYVEQIAKRNFNNMQHEGWDGFIFA